MDSQDNAAAPRRKLKFAPKAPSLRKPKPEVKTELVDNDDANQARDLLRRFNENSMKARHKVEKKVSASQIAFGDGGEASSFKSYGFAKGGSNINGSQSSASNVVREKDYKEPWDYYSYYPTTLPEEVRRPYAGNPETLDEEEFGEAAESRTYDENSSNPAMELGLLEENPEKSMFLIQLPASLPIFKGSAGGEDANENSKPSKGSKNATKPCKLNELPSGIMGKMLVYKSGKIKMKLGDTLYDVSPGMNCMFSQEAVAVNTAQKHCCTIGEIGNHVTVTPDIDAVLDQLTDL
ncbi:PREDICTED: LOW QUALITY PROTEIN: uncharacterized protein LOC109358553 [Lupinus angustifolius]|uniref:LOW QUALITY PROTEIN: uncharacterized protein LOC109358553 n=1 Tax=Lupinus angustifolius TaxID=3871 RepID=UPI00092ECFD7|nr:PREDICTED: LOW QUALITY PROTEIN: uncharacterized protein LOC109358553 [Lupinus angustifolius]